MPLPLPLSPPTRLSCRLWRRRPVRPVSCGANRPVLGAAFSLPRRRDRYGVTIAISREQGGGLQGTPRATAASRLTAPPQTAALSPAGAAWRVGLFTSPRNAPAGPRQCRPGSPFFKKMNDSSFRVAVPRVADREGTARAVRVCRCRQVHGVPPTAGANP